MELFFNCNCGVACVFTPTVHKSFIFQIVQEFWLVICKNKVMDDFYTVNVLETGC